MLTALEYGVPVVCGVALLWPTRQRHVEGQYEDNRTGLAIAALFVIAGAVSMGFVAWLSIGMDANSRRNMAIEVSAWDGEVTKIPNGKFYPSQVFWAKRAIQLGSRDFAASQRTTSGGKRLQRAVAHDAGDAAGNTGILKRGDDYQGERPSVPVRSR